MKHALVVLAALAIVGLVAFGTQWEYRNVNVAVTVGPDMIVAVRTNRWSGRSEQFDSRRGWVAVTRPTYLPIPEGAFGGAFDGLDQPPPKR